MANNKLYVTGALCQKNITESETSNVLFLGYELGEDEESVRSIAQKNAEEELSESNGWSIGISVIAIPDTYIRAAASNLPK